MAPGNGSSPTRPGADSALDAGGLQPGSSLPREALFTSLGTTGLGRFGGWIQDELLPDLQGRRWRDTVLEMRRDATLAAALFAIEMLSRQVEWFDEPAEEGKEAQEYADFTTECREDMSSSWDEFLSEVLSMLPFGWCYMETIYKLRKGPEQDDPKLRSRYTDGKIGWRRLEIRGQETLDHWEMDESGGIQGMWQMGPPDWQLHYIPIDKALLFRTRQHKNNPEGESLLYGAYRPWYFKRNIENFEGIGIERDLAGLPVMEVPSEILDPNATAAQVAMREACQKLVRRVRRDEEEGILIPSDRDERGNPKFNFRLLSSGGAQRAHGVGDVITRKSMEMLSCFLADFMLVGHEKVGSFALSTSKINLFTTALGTFLDSAADVVSEHGYTRLLRLNGMDPALRPRLSHGNIEPRDLAELGAFLQALAAAGAPLFPNPELVTFLMEQAGLPAPPEDLQPQEPMGIDSTGAPLGQQPNEGEVAAPTPPAAGAAGEAGQP